MTITLCNGMRHSAYLVEVAVPGSRRILLQVAGKGSYSVRKRSVLVLMLALCGLPLFAQRAAINELNWKDAMVVKIETKNEWCRHCPDWNQTFYSFKLAGGTTYVGQSHKKLDVALNDHVKFRLVGIGNLGESFHIIDDTGQDINLKIAEKVAP